MTARSAAAAVLQLATVPLLFAAKILRGESMRPIALDLNPYDVDRELFARND